MKIEFEELKIKGVGGYLKRAKIFGGWLVLYHEDVATILPDQGISQGHEWRPTMTFVPDPLHKWGKSDEMHDEEREKILERVNGNALRALQELKGIGD